MISFTKPPKKPDCSSDYARPILSRHPNMPKSTAGQVLGKLWHTFQTDVIDTKIVTRHISTDKTEHQSYHFLTDAQTQAYIKVFADFSALIIERIDTTQHRVIMVPLRFARQVRDKQHDKPKVEIVLRSSHGSPAHFLRKVNRPWEGVPFAYMAPRAPSDLSSAASAIDAQMRAEARWWISHTPIPSRSCIPTFAPFFPKDPSDLKVLDACVRQGLHLALTKPECTGITTKDISLELMSPYPDAHGELQDFSMRFEPLLPGGPVEEVIENSIRDALKSHKHTDLSKYAGQHVINGRASPVALVRLHKIQPATAHETFEAHHALQGR